MREKADLKLLLDRPLRRVTEYYVFLQVEPSGWAPGCWLTWEHLPQEMAQYVDRESADHGAVVRLVARVKALTDEVTRKLEQRSSASRTSPSPSARSQASGSSTKAAFLERLGRGPKS